ncbi:hypothetical protein [Haloarcula pellucida]|uniref:Uncharacterized protein n=1 Tax=Haloarcula pellucida TaxID=1427151 RepID=A0A830GNA5_9EURY|nr:hypothetical protein [Halomicroarcula pellucida]MBX0348116.1 hypothetical protein [Halomicroarcula pellucida]GGN97015.1 hypothetical protein GCM10009030_25890 [Halomicroarcula pellucida]
MGQVIKVDNRGGTLPDVLTRTGQGGFLSTGYLRDQPAAAVLDDDETPQFVLTNRKNGVTIESPDSTDHVTPGSGYRTVAVLTDRRVVVLVGDADGDTQFVVPLVEIEQVEHTTSIRRGRLTFRREGGSTWHVHTGTDGLAEVADYLAAASQAWIRVENECNRVTQTLVTATDYRDDGEYDEALSTAESAEDHLETARATALRFSTARPGDALRKRLDPVESRCVNTVAEIRVGRARQATDEGESLWREDDYEAAYEAYERAREEYEAALALDQTRLDDVDGIREERERLDRIVGHLEQSPLRHAVRADNAAVDADDPAVAADRWTEAMAHYRRVLELDWGSGDRRFAGDPEKVRERLGTVAEQLTGAQRAIAVDAMRAGDWYSDAEQYDAALTEFEAAAEAFETALATARDCYPDAVDHLETERDAVTQRIERTEAILAGDEVTDHIEGGVEPADSVTATIGDPVPDDDGPTAIEAAIEAAESEFGPSLTGQGAPESTTERLRSLDRQELTAVVADALDETVWSTQRGAGESPFDLLVRRDDGDVMGVVVEDPEADSVGAATLDRCADLASSDDADAVLLAAAVPLEQERSSLAGDREVRVLDGDSLSAIVDAQDVALPESTRRILEE